MTQIKLMQIAMRMKQGQAIKLSRADMIGCAEGMIRSALDGPARESDIEDFIKQVEPNWEVPLGGGTPCPALGGLCN